MSGMMPQVSMQQSMVSSSQAGGSNSSILGQMMTSLQPPPPPPLNPATNDQPLDFNVNRNKAPVPMQQSEW